MRRLYVSLVAHCVGMRCEVQRWAFTWALHQVLVPHHSTCYLIEAEELGFLKEGTGIVEEGHNDHLDLAGDAQ